ncbi:MAG: hypothetical protein ACOVOR_05630 [Rhabdochlamydiaceae bacterium]
MSSNCAYISSLALCASLKALFPNAHLFKRYAKNGAFVVDFEFKDLFIDSFLPLVEEKMRFFLKQASFEASFEMLRTNGIQFLLHHEQPLRAEQLAGKDHDEMHFINYGGFIDYEESHIDPIEALPLCFKLLRYEKKGRYTRFLGLASQNKQTLKELLKDQNTIFRDGEDVLIEKRYLFFDSVLQNWIWSSKALKIQEDLKAFVKSLLNKLAFKEMGYPSFYSSLMTSFYSYEPFLRSAFLETNKIFTFHFSESSYSSQQKELSFRKTKYLFYDELHYLTCFRSLKVDVLAHLRLIVEILSRLSIKADLYYDEGKSKNWFVEGGKHSIKEFFRQLIKEDDFSKADSFIQKTKNEQASITFKAQDRLGRTWSLGTLVFYPVKGSGAFSFVINGSLLGSWERVLALMLEEDPECLNHLNLNKA